MLADNGADVNIADEVRVQWLQAFWEYGYCNTRMYGKSSLS